MIKEDFKRYLEEAIGHENALVAFSAFDTPASVSVRYNPFKHSIFHEGDKVEWCRHGRLLDHRPVFTLDPLFHGGSYYVQDSSSMFVGHIFRNLMERRFGADRKRIKVLDLCAAPGGKTTDLAASLREMYGDDFLLVSNEVMKARVGILADNVALWGDPNVVVTSDDPRNFAALAGFFDVILADVPCSGEGMFRKDEEAQRQWSPDNVALCQGRQRRIVADVWPALADGGVFIYSTCTFNCHENDDNIKWIADTLGADPIRHDELSGCMSGIIRTGMGFSLVPGHVVGEGQYCSALVKKSGNGDVFAYRTLSGKRVQSKSHAGNDIPEGLEDCFTRSMVMKRRGEHIIAVPGNIREDVEMLESILHVVASGCACGTVKGKDFIPHADLALSLYLNASYFPRTDVDRDTALSFLHRDTITVNDQPKGYVMIRYEGVPLGFVKNIGTRCNNLHPQSRRIRMNIK